MIRRAHWPNAIDIVLEPSDRIATIARADDFLCAATTMHATMFPMPFANGTGPSSSTRCVDLDGEPNPNSLPTHGWVARVVASGLDRKVGRRTSSWPETREHPRAHLKSLRRHFLLAPRLNSMHDARVRNPELCDQCPHIQLMNALCAAGGSS